MTVRGAAAAREAKRSSIPALNGIRAIAIILVFMDHAGLPQFIRGATGVTIFFFLSGYLITTLLRAEVTRAGHFSIRQFYARRALRIFPPMYVTLVVAVILTLTGVLRQPAMSTGGVVAVAAFAANYWIVFGSRDNLPAGVNQFWSLAVEEHYYLLFPFALLALLALVGSWRRRGLILAFFCAIILTWRCVLEFVLNASDDRLYLSTDTRLDGILLGAIFAMVANPWLDRRSAPMGSRGYWTRLVAAAILFAIARIMPLPFGLTIGYTLEAAACWLAFDALVREPRRLPTRLLELRAVVWLGTISYGFYLVHRIIIFLIEKTPVPGTYPRAAVSFVLAIAVASVMHVAIERPVARWRTRMNRSGLNGPDESTDRASSPASFAESAPASAAAQTAIPPAREAADHQRPQP
ncbi:acyltransferase family protein [Jatrophihabitans sp. YIM 134969]